MSHSRSTPTYNRRTQNSHKEIQSILLIQKILTFRPDTSPFTLLRDSVEQGSAGFLRGVVGGLVRWFLSAFGFMGGFLFGLGEERRMFFLSSFLPGFLSRFCTMVGKDNGLMGF